LTERLNELKKRRKNLLKWIDAGEGIPANRALMEKLNIGIEILKKQLDKK